MKIHFLRTLPLLLLLGLVVAHVGATQSPEDLVLPTVEACASSDTAVDLEFPVQPSFLTDLANGGTCTSCSSHAECFAACSGLGSCIADLGLQCGLNRNTFYCFCD